MNVRGLQAARPSGVSAALLAPVQLAARFLGQNQSPSGPTVLVISLNLRKQCNATMRCTLCYSRGSAMRKLSYAVAAIAAAAMVITPTAEAAESGDDATEATTTAGSS